MFESRSKYLTIIEVFIESPNGLAKSLKINNAPMILTSNPIRKSTLFFLGSQLKESHLYIAVCKRYRKENDNVHNFKHIYLR